MAGLQAGAEEHPRVETFIEIPIVYGRGSRMELTLWMIIYHTFGYDEAEDFHIEIVEDEELIRIFHNHSDIQLALLQAFKRGGWQDRNTLNSLQARCWAYERFTR